MVYGGCSEAIVALAWFGGFFLYLIFGLLISILVKELFDDDMDGFGLMIVALVWPFAIIGLVIYVIGMWIFFPFYGATKVQLDRTESRLNRRIDRRVYRSSPVALDLSDDDSILAAFKVGDVVTGIVPQTDNEGKNISYKHLYQGCECRVLSIKNNGSMKVILIGHKDKEAHRSAIGETFTAPARNFTLVKKPAKKRKAVKKKAKR